MSWSSINWLSLSKFMLKTLDPSLVVVDELIHLETSNYFSVPSDRLNFSLNFPKKIKNLKSGFGEKGGGGGVGDSRQL